MMIIMIKMTIILIMTITSYKQKRTCKSWTACASRSGERTRHPQRGSLYLTILLSLSLSLSISLSLSLSIYIYTYTYYLLLYLFNKSLDS